MTKKLAKIVISLALSGMLIIPAMAGAGMGRGNCTMQKQMQCPGQKRMQCAGQNRMQCAGIIMSLPKGELSTEETATLLHMREEEKLARDVYLTLHEQWTSPIFANIARSEQRHMDIMKSVIDKYGLTDPVAADDERGVFSDADLQALYDQLIVQGRESLPLALKVGAAIEDLDISDLQKALEESDDEDVRTAYQNLVKGSRNHLRAFVNQLGIAGETYTPQHLTSETFDAVISSPSERGFYDEKGNPVGGFNCDRKGKKGRGKGGGCFAPNSSTSLDLFNTGNLFSRGGNGSGNGGGRGPGDGSGNGGNRPEDGSGNGRKKGGCVNS